MDLEQYRASWDSFLEAFKNSQDMIKKLDSLCWEALEQLEDPDMIKKHEQIWEQYDGKSISNK